MLKDSEKSNGCNGQRSKSWQGEKPAAASLKLPGRMAATTALWFIPLFLTLHLDYQLASTASCLSSCSVFTWVFASVTFVLQGVLLPLRAAGGILTRQKPKVWSASPAMLRRCFYLQLQSSWLGSNC